MMKKTATAKDLKKLEKNIQKNSEIVMSDERIVRTLEILSKE